MVAEGITYTQSTESPGRGSGVQGHLSEYAGKSGEDGYGEAVTLRRYV